MDNSFSSLFANSKSVLILLPTRPYFDQVAAGLSLYLALKQEKEVQIVSPSPMVVEFNRLVGVNKVSQEFGNKNLVIRFTNYKATDIEKVSYDIENSEFRLSVIPKEKMQPPKKDQIEFSYAGVNADHIVLIGGVNESHFPAVGSKDLANATLVHIGTKDINLGGRAVMSFAKPASSISEVIGYLMREAGWAYSEDIATNLLMGIEEGSQNFSDQNVSADTFELISQLMRSGGKRQSPQPQFRQPFPPGSIPGQRLQVHQTPQVPLSQPKVAQNQPQLESKSQDDAKEEAPQDWLQPKIFKGTSVS